MKKNKKTNISFLLIFMMAFVSCEQEEESELASNNEASQSYRDYAESTTWIGGTKEYGYSNYSSFTASWSSATNPDVLSQKLTIFSDESCSAETDDYSLDEGIGHYHLSVDHGSSYSFNITTIYNDKQEISDCSDLLISDKVAPLISSYVGFMGDEPSSDLIISVFWPLSISTDVVKQELAVYSGGSCSSEIERVDLSATTSSYDYAGVDGETYSFKLYYYDVAGNKSNTGCKGPKVISIP